MCSSDLEEALRMHRTAYGNQAELAHALAAGGEYAYRVRSEEHMWTPDSITRLQHAVQAGSFQTYLHHAVGTGQRRDGGHAVRVSGS